VLGCPVDLHAVDGPDQGHQGHDQGKGGGELIHPPKDQLPVHELDQGVVAGQAQVEQHRTQGEKGHQKKVGFTQRPLNKGQQQGPAYEEQRGMNETRGHASSSLEGVRV